MPITRGEWFPEGAHFPATNFPQQIPYAAGGNRLVLAYDATTQETAYFNFIVPQGVVGVMTLFLHCMAASAVVGNVVFSVAIEAVTPGDAVDLDAATSFDTASVSTPMVVPTTAGFDFIVMIPLVTVDSWAAGDYARLAVARVANHASDTAAGDVGVLAMELREA